MNLYRIKLVQEGFREIGIDLSSGFLRYSILSSKDSLSIDQLEYISSFEGITPLNIGFLKEGSQFSFLNILISKADPYDTGGNKIRNKMGKIAEANGMFDESLAASNFKGSDGNTRYDIIKSSYVLDETLRLKDASYRLSLLKKYEILKDNILLKNDSFLNNLVVDLIDGVRDHTRTSNEGVVFGDFSEREYLMQHLGFWFSQDKGMASVLFRQNEASNTAYSAKMPVKNYIEEKGKINSKGIDTIFSFFKSEYDRITREQAKGLGKIDMFKNEN